MKRLFYSLPLLIALAQPSTSQPPPGQEGPPGPGQGGQGQGGQEQNQNDDDRRGDRDSPNNPDRRPNQGPPGEGLDLDDLDLTFRRIDGLANNLENTSWSATGIPLLRTAPADYADGASIPSGDDRASARDISNLCMAQTESVPNAVRATDFLWQWGQFLDHDLDLTPIHPDGSQLFTLTFDGVEGGGRGIGVRRLDGESEPVSLIDRPFSELSPEISPDGRFLAYSSDESGRDEIYMQPYPELDGKWPTSVDRGYTPVWGPGGKELFYAPDTGTLVRIPILGTEPSFVPGVPEILFSGDYLLFDASGGERHYDLAPDGERFLLLRSADGVDAATEADRIIIFEDWFVELKRQVPTD